MAHLHTTPTLRRLRRLARQRGLTLVELMVALVVGLMVILAAMSVFSSSSQSARTVDTAGQLRDDVRFAADIIQRLAVQTGFEDIAFVTRSYHGTPQTYQAANGQADPRKMRSPISGFTGKKVNGNASGDIEATAASPEGRSDVLVLRYQAVNQGHTTGDTVADGTMMLCSGNTLGGKSGSGADAQNKREAHKLDDRTDRAVSIFYVDEDADGTPNLYCRWAMHEGENLEGPVALVKGVESFRVLYGVDNINSDATKAVDCGDPDPDATGCSSKHAKLIPTRYIDADRMTVSDSGAAKADPIAATQTNWRRVRALRVGLVLQSAPNAGMKESRTIYPLGEEFSSVSYDVNDARLRQSYVFTVNIRNCLNQGYQAAGDPGKSAAADVPPCDVIVPRDTSAL